MHGRWYLQARKHPFARATRLQRRMSEIASVLTIRRHRPVPIQISIQHRVYIVSFNRNLTTSLP